MSASRGEWESRYGAAHPVARAPSAFLVEVIGTLPVGRALDLACGDGRQALLLARHGFRVDAVDFARAGLERLAAAARLEALPVRPVQADLEVLPLAVGRYDVVVNVRYLQRALFAAIKHAVRPGGTVVFETFLRDQQQLGHPRNPAFLLERGELAERFRDFTLLTYREGCFATESGEAYLARMVARRPLD